MFGRHRFPRGEFRESPFHKGDLKYVILDLIKDKPRYGYEIIRALEERSHGFYTPSPGVIYPTLQMLEEMGYVTGIEQDGKKICSITAEGIEFLRKRRSFTDEVKSHFRHHWNRENVAQAGELMEELGKFRYLFRQRLLRMEPEKMRRIKEVVSRAYEEIEGILAEKDEGKQR